MKADSPAFAHLASGGLLIVETRETARALRYAYDRDQRKRARTAWRSARIRTLDDWLVQLWQEFRAETRDPRILRPDAHVLRVLDAIVERDSPVPLLNVDATSRAVMRSWQRLHDWQCGSDGPQITAEERSFGLWTEALRREQRDGAWIDRALLPALLTAAVPRSIGAERIAALGFDPEPPALQMLFDAFARSGASFTRLPFDRVDPVCRSFAAASADEELMAAARWACARIDAAPAIQIAVVVPDLAERRAQVRSVFDRLIDPSSLLPSTPGRIPLYSMIGGAPLDEHAIVDTALRALRMADADLSWTDLGQLLRSPYLPGWLQESGARARCDRHLRMEGGIAGRPATVLRFARTSDCGQWAQSCSAMSTELRDPRERLSPSVWAQRFGAALRAAGWGEGRPLASAEFQAANRFRELLAELAGLDPLLAPLDLASARRELERLCRDTGFQPESGDPPIRILDRIDHPGPVYDGLWITGLSAERWPRTAEPDPFLPIAGQRAARMPWASAADALQASQRAMRRLMGAAPEIIVSWPAHSDDAMTEPSSLIPAGLAQWEPAGHGPTFAEAIRAASRMETLRDPGTPISPKPEILQGGTRVLELQAKCPFRAFGELRLQALRLESPRPGIARQLRGQLAHRSLEIVWRELGSQASLRALPLPGLQSIVATAVTRASAELASGVPRRLLEIERRRLAQAIEALLAVELGRAPFQVIAVEVSERHEVGGVALNFRIDRIDELEATAGGGEFIIDYKTGRPTAPRWVGAGRDMPQLPAYAAARSRPLAGLAFAELNVRNPGFRGLAGGDAARTGIREPRAARKLLADTSGLDALVADWRAWTSGLVAAHIDGDARVDPVSASTCRECALAALCRIGPDQPADDEAGLENDHDD
ncbi:MAG TPA: PD-(D/E)XK nuclease family protein [Steroidobacteraceae bacterium]|nr:PD-(D/E)XK nuclease family protein [Steroidobacteraceae bacterium]